MLTGMVMHRVKNAQEPLRNNHYISDHFVTAPYAGHGISMLRLFMNDGLNGKSRGGQLMTFDKEKSRRLIGLFLFVVVLYNYPILSLFNISNRISGIPVLYLYLFFVWILSIVLVVIINKYPLKSKFPDTSRRSKNNRNIEVP